MSLTDKVKNRVRSIFNRPGLNRGKTLSVSVTNTQPNEYPLFSGMVSRQYQEYQNKNLADLSAWDHKSILRVLRAVSPEVSHALTTFLRVADSGYNIEVRKQNNESHAQGKDLLVKLIGSWDQVDITRFSTPGSIRDLALKYFLDALIKGAIAGELVVDDKLNVTGIAYVDPWSIDFDWLQEENRWIPYQYNYIAKNASTRVKLDIPNFFYIPVDPLGNDPYGEEQLSSAIQAVIFKFMVMQDLQMAIHVNGWRKLDYSILEEAVLKNVPPEIRADDAKLNSFIQGQIEAVRTAYASIKPDENLVHTDSVKVTSLEAQKGGMFDPKALLDVIDSQIANGLKTFSVILSKRFGGSSEGYTSSEMILYIKMVGGFQKVVESLFEKAFQLALRLQYGILATVDMEFNKPELRSDMELAQWKSIEIKNTKFMYDYQAIGYKEMQERLREIGKYSGKTPDDIREEMRETSGDVNDAERGSIEEDQKEERRAETNRSRRSGQNQTGMAGEW